MRFLAPSPSTEARAYDSATRRRPTKAHSALRQPAVATVLAPPHTSMNYLVLMAAATLVLSTLFVFIICWSLMLFDDEVHWQFGAQPRHRSMNTGYVSSTVNLSATASKPFRAVLRRNCGTDSRTEEREAEDLRG
jgi:hypothetical protein